MLCHLHFSVKFYLLYIKFHVLPFCFWQRIYEPNVRLSFCLFSDIYYNSSGIVPTNYLHLHEFSLHFI